MARFRILKPIDEPASQAWAAPANGNHPAAPAPQPGVPGSRAAGPGLPPQAAAAPGAAPPPSDDPELLARRDQLLEKFTIMQADLGGAFYEMAIRDHVRMDVLTRKAAELQQVDAELTALERMIELARTGAAGNCPTCQAPYSPGSAFCSQCAQPLGSIQGAR